MSKNPAQPDDEPTEARQGWLDNVVYNGTLVDYIQKTLEYLAQASPEVESASFLFEGRAITLTRDQALAWMKA